MRVACGHLDGVSGAGEARAARVGEMAAGLVVGEVRYLLPVDKEPYVGLRQVGPVVADGRADGRRAVPCPGAGGGKRVGDRGAAFGTGASGGVCARLSARAAAAFRRPPETVVLCWPAFLSTEARSRAFIWASSMPGEPPLRMAAAPATCGAAIEVPECHP